MSVAANLDQLIHSSLATLALPDVYLRLRETMEDDRATLDDVAKVLSLDPALAARILRIANSALYGLRSQVDTVSRAASVLGMQEIHDLTLAASVSKAIEGLDNDLMDLNTFWYRSVHCGFLAKEIAAGAGLRNSESMFIRGLLHDIGHILLFSLQPEACRKALAASDQGLAARLRVEQAIIGMNALQLVAELAAQWQLPASFIESYTHLMAPEQAPPAMQREIAMLQIAVQISSGVDSDLLINEILQQIPKQAWKLAELPPEVAPAALDASTLEMTEAMYQVLTRQELAA